jgi:hypothetical protein
MIQITYVTKIALVSSITYVCMHAKEFVEITQTNINSSLYMHL